MNCGRTVFAQVMDVLPRHELRKCVERHRGNRRVRTFSCLDQFLVMAFAQLTFRESLRDIEVCLRAVGERLYHMGIRSRVSRSTLADANESRPWRIWADFAQGLIARARRLHADDSFGLDLEQTVYALDSTTIDLCLSLFPWARFRRSKGAVKLHTLLDLRGAIPAFAVVTDGKTHDVNVLDQIPVEPGSISVMDRAYLDFSKLHTLHQGQAFFVMRAKRNLRFRRLCSRHVDKTTGLRCDQTIALTGFYSRQDYPDRLRRVRFVDPETGKRLTFLTNNFLLPPLTIADLYRCRWQVELFFKWIKQHLRIKAFFGTSENAVKTQIWIAISTYLLIAVLKKELGLDQSLHTFLQILSLTLFEKTPISRVVSDPRHTFPEDSSCEQLILFEF